MSDKQIILDELQEAVKEADTLRDKIDAIRDKVEDDLRTMADAADEIQYDLEGDDDDNPYDAETEGAENAAWTEGWQACIDRIHGTYGS